MTEDMVIAPDALVEAQLAPKGDGEISDCLGLGGGGLFVARERFDALAEVQIQLIDSDCQAP